jgi:hypothetical protein
MLFLLIIALASTALAISSVYQDCRWGYLSPLVSSWPFWLYHPKGVRMDCRIYKDIERCSEVVIVWR